MHGKHFYKTLHISLLFWHQSLTSIFTGKLILPMVLPLNRWYGKSSKFTTLVPGLPYARFQIECQNWRKEDR